MRKIEGARPITIKRAPMQQAIIAYYVQRYRVTKASVIRGMINGFALHDLNFDRVTFSEGSATGLSVRTQNKRTIEPRVARRCSSTHSPCDALPS